MGFRNACVARSVFLRVINFNDFSIFHGSGFPYQPFNPSTCWWVYKFIGFSRCEPDAKRVLGVWWIFGLTNSPLSHFSLIQFTCFSPEKTEIFDFIIFRDCSTCSTCLPVLLGLPDLPGLPVLLVHHFYLFSLFSKLTSFMNLVFWKKPLPAWVGFP